MIFKKKIQDTTDKQNAAKPHGVAAKSEEAEQKPAEGQNFPEKLQADLAAANEQIKELTLTAKRALADLQNYRKKVEEEKAGFAQFANLNLLMELIPILDNFNRAFSAVPAEIQNSNWFKGALQIEQQLAGVMRKQGVCELPSSVGKKVDPNLHEPVMTGPGEKDIVIEEFEKGYKIGDRVIRPAKVKVGDGNGSVSDQREKDKKSS